MRLFLFIVTLTLIVQTSSAQPARPRIAWPDGVQAAVSLSFDDARHSQVDVGTAVLDRHGVKATFYLVPSRAAERLEGWKAAVAAGHEMGNHSINHPCTGNFVWIGDNANEAYTMDRMRDELVEASRQIEAMLGVAPVSFAYPCGMTFIGRGASTQSYVPLIDELFLTGRGWLDEGPNDPLFADMAQLLGQEMDGKDFSQIETLIDFAKSHNSWVVLAGHEIGTGGNQTTQIPMLEELMAYAADPANGVWLAPVGEVARYIESRR
ncbi:MAG: polysaccharide deacetylase family protein [Rhodothermales bacterium]|nr:polysaccharide deacetylase family protein [Rhodothermales bacterium]